MTACSNEQPPLSAYRCSAATTLCWRPVTGTGVLLGTAAPFRLPLLRGHDIVHATRYRDRCPPRNSRPFPLTAPPRPHDVVLATRYRDREGTRLATTKTLRAEPLKKTDTEYRGVETAEIDEHPLVLGVSCSAIEDRYRVPRREGNR
ncbi:hypothetical protein RRG08_057057 [Elysia crispata]|uniref:Uncharacterized protein n=1 Tax=Elysia crispata TaxID=231223 RepID=A0AAE1DCR4_9GAST|nr:hypothetical protein RRG08_057057 [Elysia crispata]